MKYARDRLRRESEIQREIVQLYRDLGCVVVSFSQWRKGSGTRQTPGIPDLKVCCCRKHRSWWHEVKTVSGEQSFAQIEFQAAIEACGEVYILGGTAAALQQLRAIGVIAEVTHGA